jgi:hypothetical protein
MYLIQPVLEASCLRQHRYLPVVRIAGKHMLRWHQIILHAQQKIHINFNNNGRVHEHA